jgi:hypothetical protein
MIDAFEKNSKSIIKYTLSDNKLNGVAAIDHLDEYRTVLISTVVL